MTHVWNNMPIPKNYVVLCKPQTVAGEAVTTRISACVPETLVVNIWRYYSRRGRALTEQTRFFWE